VQLRTDAWVPTVAATGVLTATTSPVGYSPRLRLPTANQTRRVLAVSVFSGAVGHVEIGGVMGSDPDRPAELADTSDEDVRAYVSRLWAEDWDSAEDSVYDDVR
jgi:hypothetical protein